MTATKLKCREFIFRAIAAVLGVGEAYINNTFAFSEHRYLGLLGFAL